METSSWLAGVVGISLGWYIRGWYPEQVDPIPCQCSCNCFHQQSTESSSVWGQTSILLGVGVAVACILANAALAFKVTVVSKDDQTHRELAFQVKGKSKGVYSPTRGLQITN